ncbi:hypothetical protein QFA96_01100 [Pseudomonas sp. Ap32]|nr:hypothetical protein QFA96_01100 [Pseudomonas sp. Ap32]
MARDPDGESRFKQIRTFQMGKAPIVQIDAEERRKGFIALDAEGKLGVFHSTAHRTLLVEPAAEGPARWPCRHAPTASSSKKAASCCR